METRAAMINPQAIPEKMLKLMRPDDRKPLGKAGRTMPEIVAENDAKAEKAIQGHIANYLNLHTIEFIRPPMNKKSILPKGWPDFTLAYKGTPVGLEVKTPIGKLSSDQVERHAAMRKNGWRVEIVRGVPEVQALLRKLDSELDGPGTDL